MQRDKTRMPSLGGESEQLASLRSQQERHERLAREHATRAKHLWLRRVLLELSQERQMAEAGVKKRAKSGVKRKAEARHKKKSERGTKEKAGPRRRR